MLIQDLCLPEVLTPLRTWLPVKGGDCEKHRRCVELPTGAAVQSRGPRGGDQEDSATDVKCSEQFVDTAFPTVVFVVVLLMCFKHLVGNCIKNILRSLPRASDAWIPCMNEECKTPLQIHVVPLHSCCVVELLLVFCIDETLIYNGHKGDNISKKLT